MISKLILGTAQFGAEYGVSNQTGKPTSIQVFEMLEIAMTGGIHILDTAIGYGDALDLIGQFNRDQDNPPFEIISKFRFNRRASLSTYLKATLERLGVERLKSLMLHDADELQLLSSFEKELMLLKSDGLFELLGVSVYSNNQFELAAKQPEVDLIQVPFNLLDNNNQRSVQMQMAKDQGKIVHTRSVFLQGLFFMDPDLLPPKLRPLAPALRSIRAVSRKYSIPISSLALAYPISSPLVDGVLIGVDNKQQLLDNLSAVQDQTSQLSPELIRKIDDIFVDRTNLLNASNW